MYSRETCETALYIVYFESHDGYEPDGPHSFWETREDAEAAAGEASAMDPEGRYRVVPGVK